jgi:nucleotide-binding universal stress UspA family protein
MVSKRLIHEEGHKRKFLVIVDDTPECDRAITYAARRAADTGGGLMMLYVIQPSDFQHWIGVGEIMLAEATETAQAAVNKYTEMVRNVANIDPEHVIREGNITTEIENLIEEDQDIVIMVLAAGNSNDGPGPLVSSIAGSSSFPIPVTVVPSSLTDEEIEDLL